ncbi:MAG: SUMF1/EgtB/PvdO family nonheme iron enzyme [Candidatus Delongbacteria bacterium]|nr:SUMF1/EgtB/PvdO family nonheme iron enzyme [Candidatus Delongbacteria bacterium]
MNQPELLQSIGLVFFLFGQCHATTSIQEIDSLEIGVARSRAQYERVLTDPGASGIRAGDSETLVLDDRILTAVGIGSGDREQATNFLSGPSVSTEFVTISGEVYQGWGTPIPGATVSFSGLGTIAISPTGQYSQQVPYGWSGTSSSSAHCMHMHPSGYSYTNLVADVPYQDFEGEDNPPYIVSGSALDENDSPIPGVRMSFPDSGVSVYTDDGGYFEQWLDCGWSGMCVPSRSGWTFTPSYSLITDLSGDQYLGDFIGQETGLEISGWVHDPSSAGLSDIEIEFSGLGSAHSGPSGAYTKTVPLGWTGIATPLAEGLNFNPVSRSYSNLGGNRTGEDYLAYTYEMQFSGTVLDSEGQPLVDVLLQFSGLGTTNSNEFGDYNMMVPYDWTGTVTPVRFGWSFDPPLRSYTGLAVDVYEQDFSGSVQQYSLSGMIQDEQGNGVPDVGINVSGIGVMQSDAGGCFSILVEHGWSGTLTPAKEDWEFVPASRAYYQMLSNQTGQNFEAQGSLLHEPVVLTIRVLPESEPATVQLCWNPIPNATRYHVYGRTRLEASDSLLAMIPDTSFTLDLAEGWGPEASNGIGIFHVVAGHSTRPVGLSFPAGSFMMGQEGWEYPIPQVTLTHDLLLGRTEVTNQEYLEALQWAFEHSDLTGVSVTANTVQAYGVELLDLDAIDYCEIAFDSGTQQFALVARTFSTCCSGPGFAYPGGGYDPGPHPVKEVSWYGAACYCDWRSMMEGLPPYYNGQWNQTPSLNNPYMAAGYRLPTEAEWEYSAVWEEAMYGFDEREYPWGPESPDCSRANHWTNAGCVGWTVPVGSDPAGDSAAGLQDMAGNVYEWCNDWHADYSAGTISDPQGPESGYFRVLRGGAWVSDHSELRCSSRFLAPPAHMDFFIGFRLCRTLE